VVFACKAYNNIFLWTGKVQSRIQSFQFASPLGASPAGLLVKKDSDHNLNDCIDPDTRVQEGGECVDKDNLSSINYSSLSLVSMSGKSLGIGMDNNNNTNESAAVVVIRTTVLVLLCCQNAGHALLTRYSQGILKESYSSTGV
jgi:hypothetical protein